MSVNPSCHLHLEWIKKNPSFVPELPLYPSCKTYFEDMVFFYKSCAETSTPENMTMLGNRWLADDIRLMQSYEQRLRDKKKELHLSDKKNVFFCTIGFNHQTFTIEKCVNVINAILSFQWVLSCRAVFEFYRENGEHPHVHFLITTDIFKSKVVEKLWATKGIKSIVLKKTFIDVKQALDVHHKYIMLEKQEKKMPYVAKDIIWRQANNIPEFFQK